VIYLFALALLVLVVVVCDCAVVLRRIDARLRCLLDAGGQDRHGR
jgi:hypothetical protein